MEFDQECVASLFYSDGRTANAPNVLKSIIHTMATLIRFQPVASSDFKSLQGCRRVTQVRQLRASTGEHLIWHFQVTRRLAESEQKAGRTLIECC